MNKMNYAEMKKKFREDGYLVIPGFVDSKLIDDTFSEINELLDYTFERQKIDASKFANVDEKYMYLRENFPGIKKNVYNLMKQLSSIHFIANLKGLTDIIKNITESLLFVDSVQIRVDDPSNDYTLPLHQEGFGSISYSAISAWIPLVNINKNTGGIRFVKGSHKNGFVKHGFVKDYHAIDHALLENVKEEIPDFQRGDVLLFDSKLFHGSNPSMNKKGIRWTLVARFNPKYDTPAIDDENAPIRTEKMAM